MPEDLEKADLGSLKTIVKGAGIVFAGLVLSKVFTYLFRLFVARYYGPADYGLFSLALSVIGFLEIIALLGLATGIRRYVAYYNAKRDKSGVKGVITSSLKITLPVSILLSLLLFVTSPYIAVQIFHSEELISALVIFSISLPFTIMMYVLAESFIGLRQIKYNVYLQNIMLNASKLAFIVLFGLLGYGLLGMSWAWVLSSIATFLVALYFIERTFPIIRTSIKSIPLKGELLVYSLPLLFSTFMTFIIRHIDTIMLGYFRSPAEVGIYNAALPTAQLLTIVPSALTALFLPTITGLYVHKKGTELKRVYKTVTKWIFYINFPIFLLLVLFSRQVMNVMFGPEYVSGYVSLVLLSAGLMVIRSVPAMQMLQMLKKTRVIMYITVFNVSVNVIMNYLLIPPLGATGAAIATMTTYIISFSLFFAFACRSTGIIPVSSGTLKSMFVGLVSICVVYLLARAFLTAFPAHVMAMLFLAFALLYLLLLLLVKGFDRSDIEIIKTIEEKSGMRVEFLRRILKKFL